MNPLTMIIGFIPQVVFAVLVNWLSLGWAAAISLAVAAVLIGYTAARGGVKVLPVVQAVILAVFTVIGFAASHHAATSVAPYARGATSLAVGAFILATSRAYPFTAQFARRGVPRQYWHSPQFLAVNRRISLAWGLAVLAVGAAHLAAAFIGGAPVIRIALDWAVPVFAASRAIAVTRRAIAASARSPQPGSPAAGAPVAAAPQAGDLDAPAAPTAG
ncbi:MAG TPA: hypothetical protein VH478_21260 [Trebonia sp.]|nr:hypothetical protein [Trebonia sp.]